MSKPKTVEQILEIWERQPGARVSRAEWEFIADMRKAAKNGVGYGWMKQVIDWEWAARDPSNSAPARKPDAVSEPYKGPLESNPLIPSWCKDE